MVIRTSFRGLLIWFCAAGVLALIGLSAVETDEACGKWGYTVLDATTCQASSGYWVAAFFGGNCLLAGLSIIWALIKNSQQQRDYSRLYGFGASGSLGLGPSGERVQGAQALPPPVGPKTLQSRAMASVQSGSGNPVEVTEGEKRGGDIPRDESVKPNTSSSAVLSSVTFERKESLTFRSVIPIAEREIKVALTEDSELFLVRQSTIVGLLLAEKIKRGGQAASLRGLRVAQFFDFGAVVGTQLFKSPLRDLDVFDTGADDEVLENLEAARDDAEYFSEVELEQVNSLFDSLPQPVKDWFQGEAVDCVSAATREAALRAFVAGILYVGFQTPPPTPETTF